MNSSSSSFTARVPMRAGLAAFSLATAAVFAPASATAQEALRPEVGRPLQAAQELIKAQRFKEALAKVRDADAVGGKNANETFMIERMRIAAASGAGEVDVAARSFEQARGLERSGLR